MPVISYKFNPKHNRINHELTKAKKKELSKLNRLDQQTNKLIETFKLHNPNVVITKTELAYGYFHIYYKELD